MAYGVEAMPAPALDLFLTPEGLVTTARMTGRGTVRSVPAGTGMAPGRVWNVPVDPGLGGRLAELAGSSGDGRPGAGPRPMTARAASLCALVGLAIRAAHGHVVPVPVGSGWGWAPAPDPRLSAELDHAQQLCLDRGAVVGDDPTNLLRTFVDQVVTGVLAPGVESLEEQLRGTRRAAGQRWAGHVRARRAANTRLALRLMAPPAEPADAASLADPPTTPGTHPEGFPGWRMDLLAIDLTAPTTRLPLVMAEAVTFGADPDRWEHWLALEEQQLRRAWGAAEPQRLDDLLAGGSIPLTPSDVLDIIDGLSDRLADAGFDLIAPGDLGRRRSVSRRLRAASAGTGTLALDSLQLAADIAIDGQMLTAEELEELVRAKSELVAVRGRWVRISSDDAERLARLVGRANRSVDPSDLLTDEAFDGIDLDASAVLPLGLQPARRVPIPASVEAELRPYQQAGLDWLCWLGDNVVGGVLADDMGLGKTLQVLTWIAADPGPTLVVCPVTLVDTWARQAAQFTPHLRVATFHGAQRGDPLDVTATADVVVTTYGLLARDPALSTVAWHRVVLDEAQAIKNPDTRAARAARALPAVHRLAVTGTPVENHVGDLWSLMAFAQPGLLPRRRAFQRRFAKAEPADLGRLRAVVEPFVLRRVKTDPGILPDLPDREVIRDDCILTREQVGAYEAVVADMMGALEQIRAAARSRAAQDRAASDRAAAGRTADNGAAPNPIDGAAGSQPAEPEADLRRRAAVLAGIARLKQICVHPALLTESRRGLGDRGGKVNRLVELCGQIVDEGQAVVVFTQFASFVPDLAAHLADALGVQVATLTGSDSRAKRSATVAAFAEPDGPPILIASLKAGGTGLTLVRANHVIHLDRWWNPAVEDQASDRVWRIGQDQKVFVHVLVCPGTLEDRIDSALAQKRAVAASVVRATESAITELSDDDLAALVGLVRDRVLG